MDGRSICTRNRRLSLSRNCRDCKACCGGTTDIWNSDRAHYLFCDWSVYVTVLWWRGLTFPTHITRIVLNDRTSWYCTMLHIHSYNLRSLTQADICTVPLNRRNYLKNAPYLIFITGSKFTRSSCYWKMYTVQNLVSHFHPTHEINSLEGLPSLINSLRILYIKVKQSHYRPGVAQRVPGS
jgi:hypothetical protein